MSHNTVKVFSDVSIKISSIQQNDAACLYWAYAKNILLLDIMDFMKTLKSYISELKILITVQIFTKPKDLGLINTKKCSTQFRTVFFKNDNFQLNIFYSVYFF
jgi:hypothetical protein